MQGKPSQTGQRTAHKHRRLGKLHEHSTQGTEKGGRTMYKYFAKRIYNRGIPTYGDIDIVVSSKTPLRYNQIIKDSNGNAYIIYLEFPEDGNNA